MRPRVIVSNAMSVNGQLDGFPVDMELYYRLARSLGCDADLVGSGTILAGPEAANPDDPAEEVERAPAQDGVPLVVVDGRGRVKCWGMLQSSGYWSGFVSLATEATPVEHVAYLRRRGVEVVVAGSEKVDLAVALQELATRFGVASVRVDSGGTLNGALMRAGLVDELALLVHPAVVASTSPNPLFRLEGQDITLALRSPEVEEFEGGTLWLRYEVAS